MLFGLAPDVPVWGVWLSPQGRSLVPILSLLVLALIYLLTGGVARSLILSLLGQDDLVLAGSPLMILLSLGSCSCVCC